MKKLNIILGSIALLLASNAVVRADSLIAGPLPVDIAGRLSGTVTCSASNESHVLENIFFQIFNANGDTIHSFTCEALNPAGSCSTAVTFSRGVIQPPVALPPSSPFTCFIAALLTSGPPDAAAPLHGSICGTVSTAQHDEATTVPDRVAGSTYCLQALLFNNQSGGWTPSGGP
jgi:hypothetical protein